MAVYETPATKLSIARSKPLQLETGKWKTVKGIKVKPATQTIPTLQPGGSWTLSIKVQATAGAKNKMTLSLTAAASGLSTTSPLVVKLK